MALCVVWRRRGSQRVIWVALFSALFSRFVLALCGGGFLQAEDEDGGGMKAAMMEDDRGGAESKMREGGQ